MRFRKLNARGGVTMIGQLHLHPDFRGGRADLRRGEIDAVVRDVNRIKEIQPHMAVKARTGIPPAVFPSLEILTARRLVAAKETSSVTSNQNGV